MRKSIQRHLFIYTKIFIICLPIARHYVTAGDKIDSCLLTWSSRRGTLVVKYAITSCEKCYERKSESVMSYEGDPMASDQAHLTPKPSVFKYNSVSFITWCITLAQAERKNIQGPQKCNWYDQRR